MLLKKTRGTGRTIPWVKSDENGKRTTRSQKFSGGEKNKSGILPRNASGTERSRGKNILQNREEVDQKKKCRGGRGGIGIKSLTRTISRRKAKEGATTGERPESNEGGTQIRQKTSGRGKYKIPTKKVN